MVLLDERSTFEEISEKVQDFRCYNEDLLVLVRDYVGKELLPIHQHSYRYNTPSGEERILYFNHIGMLGLFGINNTYANPLEVSVRYACANEILSELPIAIEALELLLIRLSNGRVMEARGELNERALRALASLSSTVSVLTAGIGLGMSVVATLTDNALSTHSYHANLDKDSEWAFYWKNLMQTRYNPELISGLNVQHQ